MRRTSQSRRQVRSGLVRDRPTLMLYASLGVLGYVLNGLGAVLGPMRRGLSVDRATVAFYPSLFAAALVAVGLVGGRLVIVLGRLRALRLSLLAMAVGAALLGAPVLAATVVGAVLLGVGGALLIPLVPASLHALHGRSAAAAIGEANAVSSFASVLAPAAVATAVALGVRWQIGFLLPVLPVAVLVLAWTRHPGLFPANDAVPEPGDRAVPHPDNAADDLTPTPVMAAGFEPGRLLGRWLDLLLAVSVEFCLVFWAADAFREWHQAGPAAAPALAATFLLGMAMARTASQKIVAGRHPLVVVLAACAPATTGFTIFWAVPTSLAAAGGLLITGIGIALLYPVTLTRLVAAWPHAPDRAAARGALASGLAIGLAPLALVRLADLTELRQAYLIVPALLLILAAHAGLTLVRVDHQVRQPSG